jgi:hypothetical protein
MVTKNKYFLQLLDRRVVLDTLPVSSGVYLSCPLARLPHQHPSRPPAQTQR